MPRWLKRTLAVLAVVLIIAAGAYYWLIADGAPPSDGPAFALDIGRLRTLADTIDGAKPAEIRVEQVASFSFPATAPVAGDGWNMVPMAAFSFQIAGPSGSIVVDSTLPASMGGGLGAVIDEAAYGRMQAALGTASQIVVTHEHSDHVGGIAAYPDPAAIRPRLRLTTEQAADPGRYGAFTVPAPLFDGYAPLAYDGATAIAPGVVLMKAPGHSPGSQLVFVQMADGAEVLFIGDIGWTLRNVLTGKGRPRLVSHLMLGEDRDSVFAQLAAIRELRQDEPSVAIVPGHDVAAVDALVAAGTLARGFLP
jgi:glyoxylase-like metal-dependent hydrolase (beta-lactamase superfamily II)